MSQVITQETADQTYRVAVMSSVKLNGQPRLDEFKTPENEDGEHQAIATCDTSPKDGLYHMNLRMPDGSVEHWQQIAHVRTPDEFRALAYQRCNEDGSVYTADGGPHTYVVFPGSQGISQDRETALKIVKGEDMSQRFEEAQDFTRDVSDYLQKNAEASLEQDSSFGLGHIVVGSHSMGVYGAVPAIHTLHEELGIETDNIIISPFGAAQALEQGSTFMAAQNGVDAHMIKQDIERHTTSFRPNIPTVFSELHIGKGEGGNDMFGQQFSYNPTVYRELIGGPDDPFLGSEFDNKTVLSHNAYTLTNGLLANGIESFTPRSDYNETHESWELDHETSIANTELFNQKVGAMVDLSNLFNAAAQIIETVIAFIKDPQSFEKESFETLSEPPEFPNRDQENPANHADYAVTPAA